MKRLTPTGRVLVFSAVGFAILAAFWPAPHPQPGAAKQNSWASSLGLGVTCPLGYGPDDDVEMPEDHKMLTPFTRKLILWHNGTIWTGISEKDTAEALLVNAKSGNIEGVGSKDDVQELAKRLVGEAKAGGWLVQVEQKNLRGAFLMPGFIDPHTHFLQAGLSLSRADLGPATSQAQFKSILTAHIKQLVQQESASPPASDALTWVQGGQWDEGRWGGGLPDASWVDAATGADRPALLSRMDSHMAVANTAALKLAGITSDTPNPEGGIIDKDAAGRPTGILRENAIGLVARLIPSPSKDELNKALQAATDYALSRGVTSVTCLGRAPYTGDLDTTWRDLEEVYLPAAEADQLRIHLTAFTPLQSWERMASHILVHGRAHPSGKLFWGGVKEFADGSLGSRTALMWQPYADTTATPCAATDTAAGCEGHEHGTRMVTLDKLYSLVQGADAAGLTVAVHAIGDRAVDEVVDVFRRVRLANAGLHAALGQPQDVSVWFDGSIRDQGQSVKLSGPMHRIEHMQHISGLDAAYTASQLGVAATPNPPHLVTDGQLMQTRLGAERAGPGRSFALRSLVEAGVRCGLSSDWPVTDLNPVASTYTSVYRRNASAGSPVWGAPEALRPGQALLGHTAEAARLSLLHDYVGLLKPGLRADLVVLSSSPFTQQEEQPLPRVVATYVDGLCAWGCKPAAAAA